MHTNDSNCDIPCKLDGCQKELHHFISCPLWTCNELSTTTVSTTTTTMTPSTTGSSSTTTPTSLITTTTSAIPTTIAPPFPFPPLDHPAYLYLSLACNVLFLLILLLVAIGKCKKRLLRFTQTWRENRNRNRNRNRNQNRDGNETGIENDTASLAARFQNLFSLSNDDEIEPLLQGSSVASQSTQGTGIAESSFVTAHGFQSTFGAFGGYQSQQLNVPGPSNPISQTSSFRNTPNSPALPKTNLDEYLLMKTFKPQKETSNVETQTNLQFAKCGPQATLTKSQEKLCDLYL
jgi:hypothetical protein